MSLASFITTVSCTPIDSPRLPEQDASQSTQAAQEASSEHTDAATNAEKLASDDAGMRVRAADAGPKRKAQEYNDAGLDAANGCSTTPAHDAASGSNEDAGPSDEDAGSGHAALTRTGHASASDLPLFSLQTLSAARTTSVTRSRASIMRNRH